MNKLTHLTLTLTNFKILNPRMRHFEFTLPTDQTLTYFPGQFISLFFTQNNNLLRRNYSIANAPTITQQPQIIEIAASFVPNGLASTKLWELNLGDQIKAAGPFGTFVIRQPELNRAKRYILIATSTGVTPYRAMLPTIKTILETKDLTFVLLLGVRDHTELLYAEDFIALAQQQPKFMFITCYSREQTIDNQLLHAAQTIHFGYVQDQLDQLNPDPYQDLIYLCGNPNMVDQTFEKLEKFYKIPRARIKREKYISN